jgi:hypothetical protein
MKKLVIGALALALSAGVSAQDSNASGTSGTVGVGGLTTATLTAIGVSAAVAAAIISNSNGADLPPDQEFELVCNSGDGQPAAGVCTNTTSEIITTGTGTATSTITVPVTSTYPANLVPVN